MYLFDRNGKRTDCTEENARGMLMEGGSFSALWPKGTPAEEAAEFEALCKDTNHPGDAIVRAGRPSETVPPAIPLRDETYFKNE